MRLSTVSLDVTTIKATASTHTALSWKYVQALERQLEEEVAQLMCLAEAADNSEVPEELDTPEDVRRRQERLEVSARAKDEIEARAAERSAQEQAEYEEQVARRARREEEIGRKPGDDLLRHLRRAPETRIRST